MSKILGLDVGSQSIGCALGDSTGIAMEPLPPILRNDESLSLGGLRKLLNKYSIEKVVVGLPLNNTKDRKSTPQSKKIKGYIYKIKKHFPKLIIETQDETLSTWTVRRKYRRLNLIKRKSSVNIDSFAAMEILKDYFESQANDKN